MIEPNIKNVNVIIVGTGLIGSVLTLALAPFVSNIYLLDKKQVDTDRQANTHSRPLSLNANSVKALKELQVWSLLAPFANAIDHVHVSQNGYFGTTQFKAAELEVDHLGFVVPADVLSLELLKKALSLPNVEFKQINALNKIEQSANEVQLTVTIDKQTESIIAQALFGCDGSHSTVAELINSKSQKTGEALHALVCQLQHAGLEHSSYERFTKEGTLALLPLQHQRAGLVFTGNKQQVDALFDVSDKAFKQKIISLMGDRIPASITVGKRFRHPLESIEHVPMFQQQVLLLGNAARTIYPIAAQGFNLGLRDVMQLKALWQFAVENDQLNIANMNANLVALRKEDQQATSQLTKCIGKIFEKQYWGASHVRGLGLFSADLIQPIKKRIANRALGLAGGVKPILRMSNHEK